MTVRNGYSKTVLDNGMRVISERVPSVGSISIGVWVHAGSRDEGEGVNGVSHFIEHMHFKGTKKRDGLAIARELEALGGSINAFTSREHTCYYARIISSHLDKAVEILGDILNNSTYTPGNLRKEKAVILEEIKDVADSPGDLIHDLFTANLWPDHALGRPILGNAKTVSSMTRKAIFSFIRRNYTSDNVVIASAGDVSHNNLVKLVRKHFAWPASSGLKSTGVPGKGGFILKSYPHDTKQVHVCLGFPSISFSDQARYAILAANTLLSGGMSSRLFQNIREKKGYCYSIYSYQEFFRDIGLFSVYFGTDKKNVGRATELVLKELKRLRRTPLSKNELKQVKTQLKGNLVLSLEAMTNRMNRIARMELMLDDYVDIKKTCRNIDAVTAEDIRSVAQTILGRDRLACVTLGPVSYRLMKNIDWSIL